MPIVDVLIEKARWMISPLQKRFLSEKKLEESKQQESQVINNLSNSIITHDIYRKTLRYFDKEKTPVELSAFIVKPRNIDGTPKPIDAVVLFAPGKCATNAKLHIRNVI